VGLFAAACGAGPTASAKRSGTLEALVAASQQVPRDLSYLGKIDSHLQGLLVVHLQGGDVRAAAQAIRLRLNESGAVLVDVYVNGSAVELAAELTSMGMQIAATSESMGVVEGHVAVDRVLDMAELDSVRAIAAIGPAGRDVR
jgi:hypothetical protein